MREILFRGKGKLDGEWHVGSLTHDTKYGDCFIEVCVHQGIAKEVIPETVGQYTGLTDKNGTKIFEGDIIKIRLDYIEDDETISKVYDFNGVLCVDYETPDYNSTALGFLHGEGVYEFEVIGNIHNNPELLKGE